MGSRRAPRRKRSVPVWLLPVAALAVLALAGVVAFGMSLSDQPDTPAATPRPSSTPTPVRQVGLAKMPIPRARFCDWIGDSAIREALHGAISQQANYNSGDRVEIVPGVTDVAHEYNCTFTGVSGAQARAWVFAPPVAPGTARDLARTARHQSGCTTLSGGPRFGAPTVTTSCPAHLSDGTKVTQVTMSGLFGQSWFSCQLSAPRGTASGIRHDAERWCVHVATTLGAVNPR